MKSAKSKPATAKKASAPKRSAAKQTAATRSGPKNTDAKRPAAKRPTAKPAAPKRSTAQQAAPKMHGPRADLGAPIDAFFKKQGPKTRPILEALRRLVEETVPEATSSLKWGMPFYTLGDAMMCALGGHKAHVNLILSGPPGTYDDPDGLLEGEGKTGKHLRLTSVDQIPRSLVKRWLRTAAAVAAAKQK